MNSYDLAFRAADAVSSAEGYPASTGRLSVWLGIALDGLPVDKRESLISLIELSLSRLGGNNV